MSMNIVYSSSDAFSGIFAASVTSLFESNRDVRDMVVYLISEGISEDHQRRVKRIGEKYNREIKIIPMISVEQLAEVHLDVPKGWSVSTYGRLFLSTMLPESIDKVLYLDCDTITVGPIDALWQTDISGYMAAIADDGHSMAYRKMMGLTTPGRCYSTGVSLINLKKWRERQVEKAFIEYICSQRGYTPYFDQGVVNVVCDVEILTLPLKYNVYTAVVAFDYQEFLKLRSLSEFYSEGEYLAAKSKPVIIHYMANFYLPIRPWQKGCVHPYVDAFLRSKALTEWKDESLWEDERSAINKLYTVFCHSIPRGWAIWISSIIHEHIIPLTHKYKKARHIARLRNGQTLV